MKDINKLDLHEITEIKENGVALPFNTVMKVESGWIYAYWDRTTQEYIRTLFVPDYKKELK